MREIVLQVRISVCDNELFKSVAAGVGMKLGPWVRQTLLSAAGAPALPLGGGEEPATSGEVCEAVPVEVKVERVALKKKSRGVALLAGTSKSPLREGLDVLLPESGRAAKAIAAAEAVAGKGSLVRGSELAPVVQKPEAGASCLGAPVSEIAEIADRIKARIAAEKSEEDGKFEDVEVLGAGYTGRTEMQGKKLMFEWRDENLNCYLIPKAPKG